MVSGAKASKLLVSSSMITSAFAEVKVTVATPVVASVPVFLKLMLRSMASPT